MLRRALSILTLLLIVLFSAGSFAEEAQKEGARTVKSKKAAVVTVKKKKPPTSKSRKKARPTRVVAVAPAKPLPGPAELSEVRHWSTPDYTRVAVTLSHDTPFEQHEIAKTPGSSHAEQDIFRY